MKKFALPFLVLTLFMVLGLTGCGAQQTPGGGGGAQDTAGQALVGTWGWEDFAAWEYVFEANGEGTRGITGLEVETFLWRAEGNHLMIDLTSGPIFDNPNYITYESWSYVINNNVLTITSRQADNLSFSYIRAE